MAYKPIRAAVVGASTILGKELTEELNSSAAAAWDLRLFDEVMEEEGQAQLTAAGDEAVLIQPLTRAALEGADLVFFASEPGVVREFWQAAAKAGAGIVDLTGALKGQPGILLRSPWVDSTRPDLTTLGIACPHPAALMLALVAQRLGSRIGLQSLSATVLEPASQAGRAGVDELHQQTVSLLSFQSVPKDVFDIQIAFNTQTAFGEASKVELGAIRQRIGSEIASLLGHPGAVRLQLVQTPVFHGYAISALAELTWATTIDEMRKALNGGVVQADADTAPSNLATTESGDILIAVEQEPADTRGTALWLFMAADNLRLAARNAVAAAMELVALRPAARVQ